MAKLYHREKNRLFQGEVKLSKMVDKIFVIEVIGNRGWEGLFRIEMVK